MRRCCCCAQIYAAPARREPRVKASQCFTKYRWRDGAAALRETGPQIVATQARARLLSLRPLCKACMQPPCALVGKPLHVHHASLFFGCMPGGRAM